MRGGVQVRRVGGFESLTKHAQLTHRRWDRQTTLLRFEALRFRFDNVGAVVGGGSLGVGLGHMWGVCGVCVGVVYA